MHFVLVENALTAAQTRRELAQENTLGVRVGDMDALLKTLAELWLIALDEQDWEAQLREAAPRVENAFWQQSLKTAEAQTIAKLSHSLQFALNHLLIEETLQPIELPCGRYERYFNDLVRLHQAMGSIRPGIQAVAAQWHQIHHQPAIEPLHLHLHQDLQTLYPWQQEIIIAVQIAAACQEPEDPDNPQPRDEKVPKQLQQPDTNGKQSLHSFAQTLFAPEQPPIPIEDTYWLTCRDALQEVQVVTAMIQQAAAWGTPPERMAVVVPEASDYARHLENSLNKAGFLLSNTAGTARVWDWQSALLHDLLNYHLNPGIPMACMSVLTNPLMPWATRQGHRFAERVEKGKNPESNDPEEQALLDSLLQPEVENDPDSLMKWLRGIVDRCEIRNQLTLTKARMSELLDELAALLTTYRDQGQTDHTRRALAQFPVGEIVLDTEATRLLNAVTLIREDTPLPFQVSELFLLGFNQGNYEYREAATGAIPREHFDSLKDKTSLKIPTMEQKRTNWQARFRQLLACANDRITFSLAQYDYDGTKLEASETLVDMALCFMAPKNLKPEALLTPATSFEHPLLEPSVINPEPTPEPHLRDLTLGTDLLNAKDQNREKPLPESPSSLERLMLSPLVWVLDRFHLTSRQWEPLKADPAVQGSVAHHVFELYAKDPKQDWSDDRFEAYFEEAVTTQAPFLTLPDWEFNRRQLRQQVRAALQGFMTWCQRTGWTLAQAEVQLHGTLWGISVAGWADAILERDQNTLVLDYKKSKHPDYLKRLDKGYDLQTYIYRSLYSQSHGSMSVLSGYFTMNDCHLVSDHPLEEVPGVHAKQPSLLLEKQSEKAAELIQQRISDLKGGIVRLNNEGDAKAWKSEGVKTYALTDSNETPLIKRFTRPDTESPE